MFHNECPRVRWLLNRVGHRANNKNRAETSNVTKFICPLFETEHEFDSEMFGISLSPAGRVLVGGAGILLAGAGMVLSDYYMAPAVSLSLGHW